VKSIAIIEKQSPRVRPAYAKKNKGPAADSQETIVTQQHGATRAWRYLKDTITLEGQATGPRRDRIMKTKSFATLMLLCLAGPVLVLVGCGGSGGGTTPPPVNYTIGGTVTNLAAGDGVQLQDNGGDTLIVTANGSFSFTSELVSGASYKVSISTQPTSPAQTCGITNATGTATSNVTSVAVDCGHNEWAWMGGSNLLGQSGTYGTEGTAAPGNVPGARWGSVSWMDTSGNFWFFGGTGYDSVGTCCYLNDLWQYGKGEWTWMSGSNAGNRAGTYGTKGTAASSNVPGARSLAVSWNDTSGNFWLFSGIGYDSAGNFSQLNDLWKHSNGEWTWMSGSNTINQAGTYGTEGAAAPSNTPGARDGAVSWTDTNGNFWLFGGYGYDSTGTKLELNDLWKYSNGQWTWMGGSNVGNQAGVYGTKGTAASSNVPGARALGVSWTDTSGNFWLFGGALFNDLWKYSNGQWTWMSGSNVQSQSGTYGTKGTAASGNVPGAREGPATWIDTSGNLWLFGGSGFDSTGNLGDLSDLWKYSNGEWTWMSGANVVNQSGTYGTEGTLMPGNLPGSRVSASSWTDTSGNFWLFGGSGSNSLLNDLWKYEP
jgi:hypothetical protein